MTVDTGLGVWGQGGEFNAVDDRMIPTALSLGRVGLVYPIGLSAGSGLTVNVAAGWWAVAPVGDGTVMVVGSRHPVTVQAVPGPASGSRTDYLWCDVDPETSMWHLSVITQAAATGRPGLRVASIVAPAGSNTAAAMQLQGARVDFGDLPGLTLYAGGNARCWLNATESGLLYCYSPEIGMEGSVSLSRADGGTYGPASGTGYTALTRTWRIFGGDIMTNTRYRYTAFGLGNMGTGGDSTFRFTLAGLAGLTPANVGGGGGSFGANSWFHWWASVDIQVTGATTCAVCIRALGQQATTGVDRTALAFTENVAFPRNIDRDCAVAGSFLNAATGRQLTGKGGTFERLGGGGFVPQPTMAELVYQPIPEGFAAPAEGPAIPVRMVNMDDLP
jgi:hypothetical protein